MAGEKIVDGTAPATRRMREQVEEAIEVEGTVLITGPTGAGKELVAREIHRRSRARRPFVAVSLADRPPEVLPSELFGHERGSFTGADARQPGFAREARDGTLFLDEIGELPLAIQPRLLRLLEARSFRPVGAAGDVRFEARVVTATHRDLRSAIERREFREDLFYRLAQQLVEVPALDERREDFRPIAQSIVPSLQFTEDAWRVLEDRSYPGNVRELKAVLERIAARCRARGASAIDGDAVRAAAGFPRPPEVSAPVAIADLVTKLGATLPDLAKAREIVTKRALAAANGNASLAAKACGVPRSTFRDALKKGRSSW